MKTRTMTAITTAAMLAIATPTMAQSLDGGGGMGVSAAEWDGKVIKNTEGQVLGKVSEIRTSAGDTRVTAVIASLGNPPMDDIKEVILDPAQFTDGPDGLTVNMTLDQIASLPTYYDDSQLAERPTMTKPIQDPVYDDDTMGAR